MTCTYYSSFREHTMQQQHDLALCLYQLFALIYYLCAFAQTINNIMIIYIYIYRGVLVVIFGMWYTTILFVCYMVSLFCYMFDHCVLHGKSWQVTWKIIKCYIVEYCVLHSRALCVTWQSIVCYMVGLFCYMVDHCVLHGRTLFVLAIALSFTSQSLVCYNKYHRSFVVQSKIWCVTWKTIICYGEMCVALLHGR